MQTKATQDVRDGYARVFVVVDQGSREGLKSIYGYFSLSAYSLMTTDVDVTFRKDKQKYPYIPAILLGRLAKNKNQNRLDGTALLYIALYKAKLISEELGIIYVVTHPKNEIVKEFYLKNKFQPLKNNQLLFHLKSFNEAEIEPEQTLAEELSVS